MAARASLARRARSWRSWGWVTSRSSGWPRNSRRFIGPARRSRSGCSQESGALKLLQRVRDESHRFANTYNAQLRLRKISESILDEFPNIGERRKAALLKKFGSVQRMRLASVEQIAAGARFRRQSGGRTEGLPGGAAVSWTAAKTR